MKNRFTRSVALGLGLVLATSMALVSGGTATAGSSSTASRGVVAQSPQGQITSRLVGTTKNGR